MLFVLAGILRGGELAIIAPRGCIAYEPFAIGDAIEGFQGYERVVAYLTWDALS